MSETKGKSDSPRQTRAGSASAASSSASGPGFPSNDIVSYLTDDELNLLTFKHFQEKGFENTAFYFGIEAGIEDIPIDRSIINRECKVDVPRVTMPRREQAKTAISRTSNRISPSVCNDVMTEIFSQLNAKALIRMKTCSKGMARLIEDPFLQSLHMKRVNKGVNEGVALINLRAHFFDFIPLDVHFDLSAEVQKFMEQDMDENLECQEGLIIYWSRSDDLKALNPVTRKVSVISTHLGPRHGRYENFVVCLRSINQNEYEIISLVADYRTEGAASKLGIEVWRYSSHEWELIAKFDSIHFYVSVRNALLAKGVLYWLGIGISDEMRLAAFNLKTKILQYVPFPESVPSGLSLSRVLKISPWPNETIALIENKTTEGIINIWVRN